jgi:hypothetical protein
MPWVRYDDRFPNHRKVVEVKARDRTALTLHVLCGTWSASSDTPGCVSEAAAIEQAGGKARAKRWAKILVDAELWHAPGHDCPRCPQITKGYVIHDWPEWNPYEAIAEKRRAAGKKGAAARWGASQTEAEPIANAIAEPPASHSNGSDKKWPDPDPDPDPSTSADVGDPPPRRNGVTDGEEGAKPAGQKTRLEALVAEVKAIRPEWSTRSIERALTRPAVAERPHAVVRSAALAVARDRTSQAPGRLEHDGPWWRLPEPPSPPPAARAEIWDGLAPLGQRDNAAANSRGRAAVEAEIAKVKASKAGEP